jgi:hypothetical protein
MSYRSMLVQIKCGDLNRFLMEAAAMKLSLRNVIYVDALTLSFEISASQRKLLRKLVTKCGGEWHIQKIVGIGVKFWYAFRRPVLWIGILFLLCMSIWIPQRVLFIQVEGNRSVSDLHILQAAEQCGIYFGAKREAVRSEQVKNALLQAIPTCLIWAAASP